MHIACMSNSAPMSWIVTKHLSRWDMLTHDMWFRLMWLIIKGGIVPILFKFWHRRKLWEPNALQPYIILGWRRTNRSWSIGVTTYCLYTILWPQAVCEISTWLYIYILLKTVFKLLFANCYHTYSYIYIYILVIYSFLFHNVAIILWNLGIVNL